MNLFGHNDPLFLDVPWRCDHHPQYIGSERHESPWRDACLACKRAPSIIERSELSYCTTSATGLSCLVTILPVTEEEPKHTPEVTKAMKNAEFFFSSLRSLAAFAESEISGVVHSLSSFPPADVGKMKRDHCFIGLYYRASSNVSSLLELKEVKHFQALIMLARSLFELAVDIRLIDVVSNSVQKIHHFILHDKLRATEQRIEYETQHGISSNLSTSIRKPLVLAQKDAIEAYSRTLWSAKERSRLDHWSGLNLKGRVETLDPQFGEVYYTLYAPFSWNVHAGLTGVLNLQPETFAYMCAQAYQLSGQVYKEILEAVIKEFKLSLHDPKILDKMQFAEFLPNTETQEDEDRLKRGMGL